MGGRAGANIVNIASSAAHLGGTAYGVSKLAVAGLAVTFARELAPIRVNAVSPGVVDTGAWDGLGEQAKAQYFKDTAAKNPARRIGTPDDIAEAFASVMRNGFITGTVLQVDGGHRLT